MATCAAALLLTAGCVPAQYAVQFPTGLEDVAVSDWFADEARILVIPCWRRTGDTDTYEFGPPILIRSAEIGEFEDAIEVRSGWVVHDVYGHEGSRAPGPCGVVMAGETGSMARVDYFPSSKWAEPRYGSAGKRRKAGLLELLEGVRSEFRSESFRDIFGRSEGRMLGSTVSLSSARRFVETLPGDGNDDWQPEPESET